jgi:hypothetical protein
MLDCASQSPQTATPIPETGAPSRVKEGENSVRTALTILRGPEKEKRKEENCSDQRDLTTSSALSNCVSTPAPSKSGEFSTTKSGSTPLPSIQPPCQVYHPTTGIRRMYPSGNLDRYWGPNENFVLVSVRRWFWLLAPGSWLLGVSGAEPLASWPLLDCGVVVLLRKAGHHFRCAMCVFVD